MTLNVRVNPLLAYLLKRKTINLGPELGILLGLWSISLILLNTPLSSLYMSSGDTFGYFFRLLCTIAFPLITMFPLLCAVIAAHPSRYTSNRAHRELLVLTHVSDGDIVWAKIITALYPMRLALAVFLGIAPISIIVASLIWAVIQSQFSYTDCVSTLTKSRYCGVSYLTDPPISPGDILPVSLIILELAVGVTGIFLLATTVGAVLATYQKNRVVSVAVSSSFAIAASFYLMAVLAPDITLKALIGRSTDLGTVLYTLLIPVVPYALTFGLIRATTHLVRRTA